ncbi:peroxiredoxin Dot5p [[Candida] anglica]|uniref:thioredoxin-dependent peroxiredoxin n=1 Tax=[Candida] anglica TaxID=148631 RepID=A0ABP0EFQ4_9ASCO
MPELRRSTRVAAAAAAAAEPKSTEPALKKQKPAPKKGKAVATETPKKEEKVEPKEDVKEEEKPTEKKSEPESVSELEVGDKIPEWTFLDQDEKEIHLAKLDRSIVVIFSYPRASTPGCTRQACGFRDNYNALTSKATILGLSADSPKAQKSFATKHGFQYSLLSDPKKKLIAALGARKADGKIARSHWIFVDGVLKVKKIGISPEVSFKTAKEDVEEFAK